MVTFQNVGTEIIKPLIDTGFKKIATKSPHELARLEGPCYAIIFHSGKLLLQGKPSITEEISKFIKSLGYKQIIKINSKEQKTSQPISSTIEIGSDETLKGDTFGGIVVAGTYIDDIARKQLGKLNIRDSKELNDFQIEQLAESIRNILGPNKISVRILTAKEYNEEIIKNKENKKSASTKLLNKLHEYVQKDLDSKNQKKAIHITDKYPGCTIGDIIKPKAENSYMSVAAASIIARNAGLLQFKKMSDELNFNVPKGSTHVNHALLRLKETNTEIIKYVKIDFSNVKRFFMLD